VNLSAPAPSGWSTNLAPSLPAGESTTMTVTAPSGANLGQYSILIAGAAGGVTHYGAAPATLAAPSPASIVSPMPGALASNQNTFSWNSGVGATGYSLALATSPGGSPFSYTGTITATSIPNVTIPSGVQTAYATLTTYLAGGNSSSQTWIAARMARRVTAKLAKKINPCRTHPHQPFQINILRPRAGTEDRKSAEFKNRSVNNTLIPRGASIRIHRRHSPANQFFGSCLKPSSIQI
jgi:hypothetical protein